MCGTCGCADPDNEISMLDPESGKKMLLRSDHSHDHEHGHHHHSHGHDHHHHSHSHSHGEASTVTLETAVLARNDMQAARNRGWFEGRNILALNLVSSPGAGKTSLLEATIRSLGCDIPICVIEGDQQTANDAIRIRDAGARALQINTGAACHLEADMIARAVEELAPAPGSLVLVENVGNLVCPAMFDLGEKMKVAVISTPEGEDKPLKYPHMFRAASLVLINKIDLAPHVDFDEQECRANIGAINPEAEILSISARTGEGIEKWLAFIREQVEKVTQSDALV